MVQGPDCKEKGRWKDVAMKTGKGERVAAKRQGVGKEKGRGNEGKP